MRLAVDNQYKRIRGELNLLSVIANESYDSFAKTLQKELQEDCGQSSNMAKNAYEKKKIIYKNLELDKNFTKLWEKIKQRTTYKVELDSKKFIKEAKKKIKKNLDEFSVGEEFQSSYLTSIQFLPNILAAKFLLRFF